MQLRPDLSARLEDQQPNRLAAVAKRHHEQAGAPVLARVWIADHRARPVTDLCFFPNWGENDRAGLRRSSPAQFSDIASDGPARWPPRCGLWRVRPRSVRGTAGRRWPWDCARVAAVQSRWSPRCRRDNAPAPAATFGPRGMAAVIGQQSGQGSSVSAMQAGAQGHLQGFQVPPGFLSPAIECYLEKGMDFACNFSMNSGSKFLSSSVQPPSSGSTDRRPQIFSLSEVNSTASSWKRRNSFTS